LWRGVALLWAWDECREAPSSELLLSAMSCQATVAAGLLPWPAPATPSTPSTPLCTTSPPDRRRRRQQQQQQQGKRKKTESLPSFTLPAVGPLSQATHGTHPRTRRPGLLTSLSQRAAMCHQPQGKPDRHGCLVMCPEGNPSITTWRHMHAAQVEVIQDNA